MKILIACEFSEIVKEQFLLRGHDVHSCDYLPGEKGLVNHHQCDVRELLKEYWDMMIAFPPCTRLAVSGARWFKNKQQEQWDALMFVALLMTAPIDKIAIENPVSVISTRLRKPDQIIQPYYFGIPESKATCLWLKNLPPLICKTTGGEGIKDRVFREPPSPERWKNRSRTYLAIAEAMAEQWGTYGMSFNDTTRSNGRSEDMPRLPVP